MRNLIKIFFFLLTGTLLYGQSITITYDFEGGNVNVISINNSTNTISVSPALGSRDTKAAHFFFKVKGYSSAQPLQINLYTAETYYAPILAGVSYDFKNWERVTSTNFSDHKRYTLNPLADSLYFAIGYPYTYSDMISHVESLTGNPYLQISNIAVSEEGRAVKLLRVTDNSVNDSDKVLIWVIARQHAFESHSNYVMEGLINSLLSENVKAKRLREQSIFYVVPLMDVDNAFNGGTGKDQIPVDFNRDWDSPSYWNAVVSVKQKLEETAQLNKLEIFIDSHNPWPGENSEIASLFVYAVQDTGVTSNNLNFYRDLFSDESNYFLFRQELYPTIGQTSTVYADSVYSPGITFSLETGWVDRPDGLLWDIEKYRLNGEFLLISLSEYINSLQLQDDIIIDNRDLSLVSFTGEWILSGNVSGFYGTDYVHDNNAQKGLKNVTFRSGVTEHGYYEVFLRWTSADGRATNVPVSVNHVNGTTQLFVNQEKKGAGWVSLGVFEFSSSVSENIIIDNTDTDGFVIADAIRLSRRQGPSEVKNEIDITPNSFLLYQNYPNPFNPETTIKYAIARPGIIKITLYDILGREMAVLLNKEQSAGTYELNINLSHLPAGVYFYKLRGGDISIVRKMIMLK